MNNTIKILEDTIEKLRANNDIERKKRTYVINEEEKNHILGMAIENDYLKKQVEDLQRRIDKAAEDLATLFGTDDEDINCIIRNLKGEE